MIFLSQIGHFQLPAVDFPGLYSNHQDWGFNKVLFGRRNGPDSEHSQGVTVEPRKLTLDTIGGNVSRIKNGSR